MLIYLFLAFGLARAEPITLTASEGQKVELRSLQPSGDIPLNKVFSFEVSLPKDLENAEIFFDARMPEHNHGMVVKPRVSRTAEGTARIDGIKLHMPGIWELRLEAKKSEVTRVQYIANYIAR